MQVKFKSPGPFEAKLITEDNLSAIEAWCGGSVRGTRLPPTERFIQFWSKGEEFEAQVGDWVVHLGGGYFRPCKQRYFDFLFESLPS